jgi:DNA-binding NarL/FixJ family response regulator
MRESTGETAVVLDDQPLWLEAMGNLLDRLGMSVVGAVRSAKDALAAIEQFEPDVFVLDVELGGQSDEMLACIRSARALDADLKVVALGSEARTNEVEAAFGAGASVYCVKSAKPEDLASAIRQAFDRSIYVALAERVPAATVVSATADGGADLTRRELEILQLVAEGYSNSQLAKMLWVTEQTVKFHLSNIYRKLDVANRTEASRWAQLHGILSDANRRTVGLAAAAVA